MSCCSLSLGAEGGFESGRPWSVMQTSRLGPLSLVWGEALRLLEYLEASGADLDACWRASSDSVVPWAGSGSQAQEAWHAHHLKTSIPNLRLHFDDLIAAL